MDIVGKITSYARAVPAGLKAAGQELAKTASAISGDDAPAAPRRPSSKPRKPKRAAKPKTTKTRKQPKAKRVAAKKRKTKR